jgi:hypothetical protein
MYHAAGTMRRPEPATALLLLGIFTVSLLPPAATRAAAADTWDLRQISADERRRVIGGEIVPFTVAERTDRDLAAGAMMFLPLPVPRVGDYLAESELAVRDPGVVSWGALPERAEAASLAKLRLSPAEADELLDARPGSVWNLSGAEMEALRAMRSMLPAASRTLQAESVSAQYRAILLRRTQAYRAGGLDAIDPYARRGGTTADPAAELRLAAEDARALTGAAPSLVEALLHYPALQHAGSGSQLYWVERRLQGRVDPVLVHQLVDVRPALALHVERHFFVGHAYNSSQTLTGAMPWGNGALVFVVARVSTDLVAGLGGDVKRSLGRRQLRGDLSGRLERVRAGLTRPTPLPQSP